MPRIFREALMSVGTVVILLLVLVGADDRVRDLFSRRVLAHPTAELAGVSRQLSDIGALMVSPVRDAKHASHHQTHQAIRPG